VVTKSKKEEQPDSVEQIRNILFGEQIQLIESRFEKLETSINEAIENLSDKLVSTNKELANKIELSNKKFQTENSSLAQENTESIKNLETALSNKIIETESDLLNQIQKGLQKLDDKASHRKDLAQLLKDMAAKLTESS